MFSGMKIFSSACRHHDRSLDRFLHTVYFCQALRRFCRTVLVAYYFRGRERPLLYHEACAKWLSDENPTSSTSEVMDLSKSLVPTIDKISVKYIFEIDSKR
jgi:hypothetical protein